MMAYYGINVKTAAERLGHDVVTMLKIYNHSQKRMDRGAAESLGNMCKNPPVVTSVVNNQKEGVFTATKIAENSLLN
jgi:hypothetical protein